jgi:hypothetical protein
MARNSRRTYNRDAKGRFASGSAPGAPAKTRRGAKKPTGGTAPARAKLRGAMARQAEAPSPQRKGAVTRAKKALKAAKAPVRLRLSGRPERIASNGRRRSIRTASGAANSIRPSRLKPRGARNNVRPAALGSTGRKLRGDRARSLGAIKAYTRRLMRVARNHGKAKQQQQAPSSNGKAMARAIRSQRIAKAALAWYQRPRTAVVPYRPVTLRGRLKQIERQMDRSARDAVDAAKNLSDAVKKSRPKLDRISWQIQRMNADAIAKRFSSSRIDRELASIELGTIGGRSGAKAIRRRMGRAAAAAARGSRAAARARVIYGNQLAAMGPGKTSPGKNGIRPGPGNTKGTPRKRRKRKPRG